MGTISISVAEYKRLLANELAVKFVMAQKDENGRTWLDEKDLEVIADMVAIKEEEF